MGQGGRERPGRRAPRTPLAWPVRTALGRQLLPQPRAVGPPSLCPAGAQRPGVRGSRGRWGTSGHLTLRPRASEAWCWAGSCALWGPAGTQELLAGFSLLGELEEDEDEDEEKVTPVRPGGLVAVFCPVRLLRQTGQLSCFVGTEGEKGAVQRPVGWERRGSDPLPARPLTCSSQGTMQPSWNRWLQGSCRTRSPSP